MVSRLAPCPASLSWIENTLNAVSCALWPPFLGRNEDPHDPGGHFNGGSRAHGRATPRSSSRSATSRGRSVY